ncbi:response regulator receiver domain-containing protein [Gelidibacter sediminis]|uniref:Response regulator receiver domain-containing protein n=1 Tax=Gelidibacter sediminis TaxID=1608710 RepID=A0A4R7Q7P9_9FLAO|nr:response regulator [Gelidibacter sediminis]TDU43655.1 response regulator receiver domain-containing protein [Gelidibacter sediminis]
MQEDYTYVVLADDDEDDRLFFVEAFEELKIKTKVDVYKDGIELMDALNQEDSMLPNILFLDLNMPKKSGLECLIDIKANNRFKDMAIAIYSTSASEEDIENTFVQGANIYIKKPSAFNDLKKILSDVVTVNWQYHTNGLDKENFLLRL